MSASSSEVVFVNEWNFEAEVLASPEPVLIDVSAAWCAPCKLAAPIVKELARLHSGRLKVVEVDGGESPELATRLGVRGFPTFLGVVGGEIVERRLGFSGARGLNELAAVLLAATPAQAAV